MLSSSANTAVAAAADSYRVPFYHKNVAAKNVDIKFVKKHYTAVRLLCQPVIAFSDHYGRKKGKVWNVAEHPIYDCNRNKHPDNFHRYFLGNPVFSVFYISRSKKQKVNSHKRERNCKKSIVSYGTVKIKVKYRAKRPRSSAAAAIKTGYAVEHARNPRPGAFFCKIKV